MRKHHLHVQHKNPLKLQRDRVKTHRIISTNSWTKKTINKYRVTKYEKLSYRETATDLTIAKKAFKPA